MTLDHPLVPGFFLVAHGQHQDKFGVNLVDPHIRVRVLRGNGLEVNLVTAISSCPGRLAGTARFPCSRQS